MLAGNAFAEPVAGLEDTPPSLAPPGRAATDMPQPLPPRLATRIRRIFALQSAGDMNAAERESSRLPLDTPLRRAMLGHILADRYLGRFTHPTPAQLGAWLRDFGDLPDAAAIRALRRVRHRDSPPSGVDASGSPGHGAGETARTLFIHNRDEEAYEIGVAALANCRRHPRCDSGGLPAYIAGVAAWRLGRAREAQPMFVAAWQAPSAGASLRAAAAFWAARAALATGDARTYGTWMERAAAEAGSFYGTLAGRTLGLPLATDDDDGVLTQGEVDAVAVTPHGLRAFALMQVGQPARAAAELWALWQARTEPALDRALMLVAARMGADRLAAEIAATAQDNRGLPRARLRPRGGFTMDPAMIYALARAESNFDAALVSPAGARGLLQITPQTAFFITQGHPALHNAAVNLAVGQQYIAWLATSDGVSGDLIRLLASYNAGPAGLARVSGGIRDAGDPLLFIEAMPIPETRLFIERVLTYTWLYAAQLRLPAPSLDELAAGRWPRYHLLAPMRTSSALH